jgi:hypothetical protein
VDRDGSAASGSSSLIDEIVREGARRMLAEALQAEVDAYIARFADLRDDDGRRLVVRNGYHEAREVTTCAGAVAVHAPRVNDRRVDLETSERQRFCSAILPPWAHKPPQIEQVLPLLYLHGLSSGDFVAALGQFLGSTNGLSSSTITRLTETLDPGGMRLRGTCRAWTMCTCGPMASTSTCGWTRRSCACWC